MKLFLKSFIRKMLATRMNTVHFFPAETMMKKSKYMIITSEKIQLTEMNNSGKCTEFWDK